MEEAPALAAGDVCSLDHYLVQPDESMDARIAAAREKLAGQAIILGHHYQRDEVIRFADFTGDSYKLSKAASETEAKYMVFCGVHFMAETADILARPWQQVILPDLNAGCSMADMAEIGQVEDCWDSLQRQGSANREQGIEGKGQGFVPLTYMNSAAEIKAFCGERGGLVCTSSNARAAFEWAFRRGEKILFLPDQHLGRNTAFAMGIPLNEMVVWDPYMLNGGVTPERLRAAKVILWKGHCSVHQRFLPEHVDRIRREEPGMQVVVHPECRWEVCQKADALGSTERIIDLIERARQPPRQALRSSGQARNHARRVRLPLHDHVPDLAPAPRLDARKSAGRPRRKPHQSCRRGEILGQGCARPDAGDLRARA
jgi:quinolinate synthase